MVAFWHYDLYPFVLGGHVTDGPDRHERVETREFGRGHRFQPFRMVSDDRGEELLAYLEQLERAHRDARDAFNQTWRNKVKKEFPELTAAR